MERVRVEDVEPDGLGRGIDRRSLSEPLGTTDVAVNRYRLAPGERFSGSVHAHTDQEEVFLVVAGEATFETPDGEVTVGAGEAVRFGPGEFQSGYNAGDGPLVAFALGAPKDGGDVLVRRACPDCGAEATRPVVRDGRELLACPECGAEFGGE